MVDLPDPIGGRVGDLRWELRPEWLAGRFWWRVYLGGHPKVLVRFPDSGVVVAEALARDELRLRQEQAGA